jgi:hypothetical protein
MPEFAGIAPWHSPTGPVPAYPLASNDTGAPVLAARNPNSVPLRSADPGIDALRAELRALVVEELAQLIKR